MRDTVQGRERLACRSAACALAVLLLAAARARAGEVGIYQGVSTAVQFDVSPPLHLIAPVAPSTPPAREIADRDSGLEGPPGPQDVDSIVQTTVGSRAIAAPLVSFDGPPRLGSGWPPDPVGDVGPSHYVAMTNVSFAVYSKDGTPLFGPVLNNTLWSGFGGACQNENAGDAIVVYDQLADRWLLTQFTGAGPTYYNCVGLSTSGDPTGTYYRWAFSNGTKFPDYPKFGMWPDAYYVANRNFDGENFSDIGALALNRAQMLAGNPSPQVISFAVPPGGTAYNVGDGLLPADLDGTTEPPLGSPAFFVGTMDNGGPYGAPQDALTLWEFHADFVTPASSTFIRTHTIPVAAFDSMFPCGLNARRCIPQPGTTNKIDILSYRQRPTWRLAYRNTGKHESLVTNQSVEAAASLAGIRWYEIRDPNGDPTVFQQGTYAPGTTDGVHRWMGSVAMNAAGDIALGFSASDDSSTYPSVWYSGRLVNDPLGTLPLGEGSIIDGSGSQDDGTLVNVQRWGDYTSLNVDPVDDCTFWYINEYYVTTGLDWRTRIGSFRFDSCLTHVFYDGFEASDLTEWDATSP